MKREISLIMVGALVVGLSTNVYAQTDEELLELYGRADYSQIRSEVQQQQSALEEIIDEIEYTKRRNEEYNRIIDEYNNNVLKSVQEKQKEVNQYIKDNQDIAMEIGEHIVDYPISELKLLNQKYYATIQHMNTTIASMNDVHYSTDYRETDYNLSSLYNMISDLDMVYENSVDGFNIGDISDIQWIADCSMKVQSPYGYRVDMTSGASLKFHTGTDFLCPNSTKVGALFNGEVIDTGYTDSIGNYITVACGGKIKYVYCNLSEVYVHAGDLVKQYQTIGLTGSTGSKCVGSVLHITLYIKGVTYDVARLFSGG